MLDFIEDMMEATGCDWETAAREYYAMMYEDDYYPEDYE